MLPALVSLHQFADRLPGGVDGDEARAQAALDDASAEVRAAVDGEETWVDEDGLLTEVPDIVQVVTIAVARRAFVNPEGISQESVAAYGVSYATGSGDVYLTRKERQKVRRAVGLSSLGTIELGSPHPLADALPGGVQPKGWIEDLDLIP